MPEYLRSLIVILVLAIVVFTFAKVPACAFASTKADFLRRRNLWFAITITTFLANNYWIYIVVVAGLVLFAASKEKNKLPLFFLIMFAVPAIPNAISGMGVINFLFVIDYQRLLALCILFPAFLYLRKQKGMEPFGHTLPEKLLAGYLILQVCLLLQASTLTNALRLGAFYPFLGVFLPYYVASRSMRSIQEFRDALMCFCIAAMVLSALGFFEFLNHWLLYSSLEKSLDAKWGFGGYLGRGEGLRALASTGQPIPLGYTITVAIGFFLYLKKSVPNAQAWMLGMVLLTAGLIAPLSRGPWVGAMVMLLLYVLTSPYPGRLLVQTLLISAVALPVVLLTPLGTQIVDYLPWVGTVDEGNVEFRNDLLSLSMPVIMRNPFFGAYDYLDAPELQVLAQGNGFIDIVSTYVGIALAHGLVGLFLFSSVLVAVIFSVVKAMRKIGDKNDERYVLGQVLFSALIATLIIIGTVSSITVIPVIYWSVAGLGVAYVQMLKKAEVAPPEKAAVVVPRRPKPIRPRPAVTKRSI